MVQLDRGGQGYQVCLLVVQNSKTPLLSLETSRQLCLVKTIDSDSTPKPKVLDHQRQVRIGTPYKQLEREQILRSMVTFSRGWLFTPKIQYRSGFRTVPSYSCTSRNSYRSL